MSGICRVVLAALLLTAAACPGLRAEEATRTEAGRTIRIATEGAHPPYNYVENNEPAGFEIDLARALCAVMQAQCTFVIQDWDGMIGALKSRRVDAIMSSMQITQERRHKIAFSRAYYRIPTSFIASKDADLKAITPDALKGKTIGTSEHSEYVAFLEERYKQSEVKTYDKLEDANLDLLTGRIDLVLGDKLTLTKFLETREGSCCRLVGDAPPDPALLGEGIAVGLRKSDPELKAAFDKAIGEVQADGTYDRLRAKYVPFDIK